MRFHPAALTFVLTSVLCGLVGCDRSTPNAESTMTTEEIIRQNANGPVGRSIIPVVTSLAKHSGFVATESSPSTQPTTVTLDKLRFRTAQDNQGRMWGVRVYGAGRVVADLPPRLAIRGTRLQGLLSDH